MHSYRKPIANRSRSYWLSASNYYVMTLAFALAAFFLVLGLFRDGNEEPFFAAGIAASAVLVAAVIVRRAIISKHQLRHKAARQLESNLLALRVAGPTNEKKLTIEKNASILKELKRKSEAATVLGNMPKAIARCFSFAASIWK